MTTHMAEGVEVATAGRDTVVNKMYPSTAGEAVALTVIITNNHPIVKIRPATKVALNTRVDQIISSLAMMTIRVP